MLKPGALPRRIVGEVLQRLERKGFRILALKLMMLSQKTLEQHYAEHVGKEFYEPLLKYMKSGPVLAMVLEGESGITLLRKICGPTNVAEAPAGTIRGDFASLTRKNIIHASDSVESAEREIALYFKPEDILDYPDEHAHWYY